MKKSKYYKSIEKALVLVDKEYEKRDLGEFCSEILHLFLPLDIDMQALEILEEKKRNGEDVKDPKEYLDEMYKDNINYLQRLEKLKEKVKELEGNQEIDNEKLKRFTQLCNNKEVYEFFENLNDKLKDASKFLKWKIDDRVTTFHDWYCALAKCLMAV